jgi:ribosome maturation factor RimP
LFAPIDGQKNFHGMLTGASDEAIALKLDDGRDVSLPRSQVAKSKLDPKIEI